MSTEEPSSFEQKAYGEFLLSKINRAQEQKAVTEAEKKAEAERRSLPDQLREAQQKAQADSKSCQEFLQTFALHKPLKLDSPNDFRDYKWPALRMNCRKCGTEQTFVVAPGEIRRRSFPDNDHLALVQYTCAGCDSANQFFFLRITESGDTITKIGQYPTWSIAVPKALEQALGNRVEFYRKGLASEAVGYGIGAYGYYRRVVEEIIDELLDGIGTLIEEESRKQEYMIALAQTKSTRQTEEKARLVKDLMPGQVKVQGMNPLGILHTALSEGLHNRSDVECLYLAVEIRAALDFLITRLAQAKEEQKKFTDSMRRILEKKAPRA